MRKYLIILVVLAGAVTYYFRVYRPEHSMPGEHAYVRPDSLAVFDSQAEVHGTVATVHAGERLGIVEHDGDWVRVQLPSGLRGWVEWSDLIDSASYESGRHLLTQIAGIPPQAEGHTTFEVNLHLEPSRDGQVLTRLRQNQHVQIFARRVVTRVPETHAGNAVETASESEGAPSGIPEAWYLVRADTHAGWVLGRLITLDVPDDISPYAQDVNMVAWIVIDKVRDGGREIPQYLVADRIQERDVDFNHIRVFTWWPKQQRYVTAYVESKLAGYFPIRVNRVNDVPYFRLRLLDKDGRKVQKVYALEDTMVHPLGFVNGWTSDAIPTEPSGGERRARRR